MNIFADSVTTLRLQGLDFSPWAQSAFPAHVSELSADRLGELGVDDPDALDVRASRRGRPTTRRATCCSASTTFTTAA